MTNRIRYQQLREASMQMLGRAQAYRKCKQWDRSIRCALASARLNIMSIKFI